MLATLSDPYYDHVKSGIKTVEGRLNNDKWSKDKLKEGDIIIFRRKNDDDTINESDRVKVQVEFIHPYDNVEEMLRAERLKYTLPGVKTIKEGVKIYTDIYDKDTKNPQTTKYGMVGIGIKLIN